MHVAIYVRSARVDQVGLDATNREACLSYAAQAGHDVVTVYDDSGQSGLSEERQGLRKMMEAAQTGSFNGIIVDEIHRLSRDMGQLADILQRLTDGNVSLLVVPKAVS